jgi:hypothetical protein
VELKGHSSRSDVCSQILFALDGSRYGKTTADSRTDLELALITSAEQRLFVLDNVDDILLADPDGFQDILRSILKCTNTKILATSRHRFAVIDAVVDIVDIPVFSKEEGLNLLKKFRSSASDDDLNVIASLCGLHPLALSIVGSLLDLSICTPRDIIDKLSRGSDGYLLSVFQSEVVSPRNQIEAAITTSLKTLGAVDRMRFADLATFPTKFRLSDVQAFLEISKETAQELLDKLLNRSLVTIAFAAIEEGDEEGDERSTSESEHLQKDVSDDSEAGKSDYSEENLLITDIVHGLLTEQEYDIHLLLKCYLVTLHNLLRVPFPPCVNGATHNFLAESATAVREVVSALSFKVPIQRKVKYALARGNWVMLSRTHEGNLDLFNSFVPTYNRVYRTVTVFDPESMEETTIRLSSQNTYWICKHCQSVHSPSKISLSCQRCGLQGYCGACVSATSRTPSVDQHLASHVAGF